MDSDYVTKLESVIKQMLRPLRGIPLHLVIRSISGQQVIPFNDQDPNDLKLLQDLKRIAQAAGEGVNQNPIVRRRPNEVGNDIEPYVKEALRSYGYGGQTPMSRTGRRRSTGYPDIQIHDPAGRACYIECKTYNIENIDTTQRSFYLSPSEDSKITEDGHHLVLSYEIYVAGRRGSDNVYKCRHWKIIDAYGLDVDVKYEFNSDNARLYSQKLVLAEGDIA